MSNQCGRTDLVQSRACWLLWGVPIAMLVAGATLPAARTLLWTPAFAIAGIACVVNARRCGRLHCFATGPLYLLLGVATVVVELDLVGIDPLWLLIGGAAGTVIAYAPEWIRGRYLGPQNLGEPR
jgi:hypothetical protein